MGPYTFLKNFLSHVFNITLSFSVMYHLHAHTSQLVYIFLYILILEILLTILDLNVL
jgi:hypothetical protein